VAVIGVGAAAETELREKTGLRCPGATRGLRGRSPWRLALINAIEAIKDLKNDNPDINAGSTLRRALEEPMRQLARNAGQEGAIIIDEVRRRRSQGGFIGYNVMTEAYEDMLKAGIIDPAKVTRSAVQNAASIAAMILTTEALIVDIPEPPSAMPAGGGMGDMGGMM
jgi:chaperonin GroEL